MPFQNHLEFIIKTLPGMMLHRIADITNCDACVGRGRIIVPTQSSLRDSHPVWNQYPALR
jgi:hypothetical protein